LEGTVRTYVDIRPTNLVSFRGAAGKMGEKVMELVGDAQPFHITKIFNSMEDKVAHQLETVEDGKHYRLKLRNLVKQGRYSGSLVIHTDLAQKPDIMVYVNGIIDGEM
jgi:dihydrodipicolinate reductase